LELLAESDWDLEQTIWLIAISKNRVAETMVVEVEQALARDRAVDLAMVGANAVAAVVEQPVAVRTADAAAVQGKTVGGLATVEQLRGVADDQREVHARPLIRTTAG
jgi:hypothetical protein